MVTASFLSALANHLWQSTLVVAVAAALVFAMRKNHARTRYWLWLAASLKFLIPFSVLVALGSQLAWQTSAPLKSQPELSFVFEQFSQPVAPVTLPLVKSASASHMTPLLLLGVWALGSLLISVSWVVRWMRIRAAVRAGHPVRAQGPVPVISSPSVLEPGVFGIFKPVLLLPNGITEHLSSAHLKAIFAHEFCHVRHRDNLAAAIHMAVQAIFWFHPLVWWLGGRLVDERERACDEEVLGLGNQPEVYAESILKTCEFYLTSPLPCVSGVTGSDLKKRIRRIMTGPINHNLETGKKLLLTTAALAAVIGPLAFGVLHAAVRQAPLTPTTETAPQASFEVASIKPDKSGEMRMMMNQEPGGHFRADGIPLKLIFEQAYDIKDAQLIGAPEWFGSDRYDIEAKPDEATSERMRKLGRDEAQLMMRQMLRGLLEERCQMKLNRETRELPIYSLIVGRGGPKFHEAAPLPDTPPSESPNGVTRSGPNGASPRVRQGIRMGRGDLTLVAATLDMFSNVLSRQLGRPVVNNTGLKGNYDFELKWTPDQSEMRMGPGGPGGPGGPPGEAPPPPEENGPSIFTAVQEQLGLKLDSTKAPMQVFVISHIERPSAN